MPTPFNPDAVIPNAESAYVAPPKLRDYALNPDHPKGRHKARVFKSVLGFERDGWEDLRDQLLSGLMLASVADIRVTYGGYSAEVPIEVTGPNGRTAVVISGWYVADADPERRPSLATAYVDI